MFSASTKTSTPSGGGTDPQFNYVTMLLHGDGTNGAQNNTFLDSSTNNFTITRTGTVTQGSFSPYGSNWSNNFGTANGNALSVTLSGSELSISGDFTLETWIYPTAQSSSGYSIIFSASSSAQQIAYYYTDGRIGCYFANGANGISSTGKLPMNAWSHVAVVRSGSTVKIYVNGVDVGVLISGTTTIVVGTIGGYTTGDGYNVYGYLSNVRVGTTAVYTSDFTPPTTPLTAITGTQILTCQSNGFVDNSGNGRSVAIVGTPSVQRFNPFGTATAYSTSVIGGSSYTNGSGSLILPSNNALAPRTSDFTFECWMYSTENFTNNYIGLYVGEPSFGAFIGQLSTGLFGIRQRSNADILSRTPPPTRQWVHIAITRSGTNLRMFYNGIQQGATETDSTDFASGATSITDDQYPFYGYLSNLRFVKGTAVYTSNFTPPTSPVTAITNTQLLTNFTNGAIFDNAMMNDLETVGNAQISTSVVKYGTGSLYFDGTGDSLSVLNTPTSTPWGTESWTIEGWIYPTAVSSTYRTIYANGYPIQIFQTGGSVEIYISSTNGFSYIVNGLTGPASSVSANTWTHFAVVKNGNVYTVYVNGVGGSTVTSSTAVAYTSTVNAVIGDAPFGSYPYVGYIDDLRITKGYARYTANFTPPTAAFSNTGPL